MYTPSMLQSSGYYGKARLVAVLPFAVHCALVRAIGIYIVFRFDCTCTCAFLARISDDIQLICIYIYITLLSLFLPA